MLPRDRADLRTLLWMALAVAVVGLQLATGSLLWTALLAPLSFYFALCSGIIAHNHNHCPVFSSRRMNDAFGHLLTVFYGYPTFVWVPTHNLNHHKHVNRAGDATITWRYSDRHNAFVASTYFFVSAYFQAFPIRAFLEKARNTNRRLLRKIRLQYAIWLGTWFSLWAVSVAVHGLRRGSVLWAIAIGLPALFTLWTIMFFNYEQHVHTDPWSEHNHSRNFTSPILNFLLFNNGFHGVHHEQPGLHWSRLPEAHAQIADQIDPDLLQRSMWRYMLRQFVLASIWPAWGTQQVGRAPYNPPHGDVISLAADDVELGEAGANTTMAPVEPA